MMFDWDNNKNEWLKKHRGVSFEDILYYIQNGNLLDEIKHPNQKQHKGQKMFIIEVSRYAFLVPFVLNGNDIFLKTIIPSRKATKEYIGGK